VLIKATPIARPFLAAVWKTMDERNLGLIAAGVAFYAMFAVFPGMAATIALWGFFASPEVIPSYLEVVHEFIPEMAYGLLESQMQAMVAADHSTIGWTTGLSLVVAIYSVHNAVAAMIDGLNALHAHSHKTGLARFLASIAITFALFALVFAALAAVVVAPALLAFLPILRDFSIALTLLPLAVMVFVGIVTLGLFYRYGPNHPGDRPPWITPGSLLASALWAAVSLGFSIYLANFNSYNRIYGSIGAVVALLMWFYLLAYVVLLGGVVNLELERLKVVRNVQDRLRQMRTR
jgi:membrane protein